MSVKEETFVETVLMTNKEWFKAFCRAFVFDEGIEGSVTIKHAYKAAREASGLNNE